MKKVLSVILSVMMIVGMIPLAAVTASAAVGDTFTVQIDGCDYEAALLTDTTVSIVATGDVIGSSVTIPETVTYGSDTYTVTAIGQKAFAGYDSIRSIVLPDSVTSIGAYAFNGCVNLVNVVLPDSVTSIGAYAFNGCVSLVNVVLPADLTSIPYYAFYGCRQLQSIVVPEKVSTINQNAFSFCESLRSAVLPAGVTCNQFAFYNSSVESLIIYGDQASFATVGAAADYLGRAYSDAIKTYYASYSVTAPANGELNAKLIFTAPDEAAAADAAAAPTLTCQLTAIPAEGYAVGDVTAVKGGETITLTSENGVYSEDLTLTDDVNRIFPTTFSAAFNAAPAEDESFKLVDKLKNGDEVILYNPASGAAVKNEPLYKNWYLAAASVTPVDGEITGADPSVIWTVSIADGKYTFSNGDDKITAWASGSYPELTNDPAYDSSADAAWTVADSTVGDHMHLLGTGVRPNCYMNVSTKNVSGVSMLVAAVSANSTAADDEAYVFCFYVRRTETPHEHTFSTDWTSDEIGHWHECTADDCDIEDYATCGLEGAAYAAHVYDQKAVADRYLKDEATYTRGGIYYMSCKCGACDKSENAATFTDYENRSLSECYRYEVTETGSQIGRQGKINENGYTSSSVGRTIIPLTAEQLEKIGDTATVIFSDGTNDYTITVDSVYTYFYDVNGGEETLYTAEDEGCAAFIIIDNNGSDGAISGYGYFRVYNGSVDETNFLFDALIAPRKPL